MPKSRRNWAIKSCVASPIMPPSRLRSSPPARIIRKSSFAISVFATFKLLVTIRKLLCPNRACATASGVVPISINSVEPLGIWAATLRAMRSFSSVCVALRSCHGVFTELEGNAAPPWWRKIIFCSARSLRSRRMVCGLTEKCSTSSSVLTYPCFFTSSMIASCRCVCFMNNL